MPAGRGHGVRGAGYNAAMDDRQSEIIVVGAGAAGLFAATAAAEAGAEVTLLEKSRKFGVKILMSGGTRCNLTQDTDWRGIADAFGGRQARFLKFSLAQFTPARTIEAFEAMGVRTKVESTGKIFPVSDRAVEVRDALVNAARGAGVNLIAGIAVERVERDQEGFRLDTAGGQFNCRQLIITTGGQSYPECGTSGDGYHWLRQMGHQIVTPRPALTPIRVNQEWVRELAGITVPDVRVVVRMQNGDKRSEGTRSRDRGSFLFTHRGCSGPAVLNVSRTVTDPANNRPKSLVCDWLPTVDQDELHKRLLDQRGGRQSVAAAIGDELPRRLVESVCRQAQIRTEMTLSELGRKRSTALVHKLKLCELAIDGTLGFARAEVTAGGVALEEVDPLAMASRIVPGLYLAGEILDVDGPIGGYNFQAAWSTGHLAGSSAAANLESKQSPHGIR